MSQQFLDKKDIKGQQLIDKTIDHFIKKYKQIKQIFSYSDPFGQIILVLNNHLKILVYYVKDSLNEMSYQTANRRESIYGLAELNGHSAHRGTGATCSIALSLNKGLDLSELTNIIYLPNYMKLRCIKNDLIYYVNLGDDFIKYDIINDKKMSLNVIQGEMKITTFVGNGRDIQTYSIPTKSDMIDTNHITIQVNGENADIHDGIEDFVYGELNVMVRTGLTGGIDIIFGKSINSKIPLAGNEIRCFYPIIHGSKGNESFPIFEFIDVAYKSNGEPVDMKRFFLIKPEQELLFGSDPEDIEETKLLAPNANKNRIIHDMKSLDYFLRKLNLFGDVKIFNNNQPNLFETYLFPKLINIVGDSEDYFNFNHKKILLNSTTKDRLLQMINVKRSQNIDVVIYNPTIKSYSMIIKADAFRNGSNGLQVNIDELRSNIRKEISDYMLSMKRTNKIPKSDIIKIVDNIAGIDSVYVEFIVEQNSMLDSIGNIILNVDEIALPSNNFTTEDGEVISESITLGIEHINN